MDSFGSGEKTGISRPKSREPENRYSILVVSGSEQFDAVMRKSLKFFTVIHFRKNAAAARRGMLEQSYDMIVINSPLPDEFGEQFALDVAQHGSASVLMVVPAQVYEDVLEYVTDEGILVISKPLPQGRLDKAIRFLAAIRARNGVLEKKLLTVQERLEEIRIVDKAKFALIEHRHLTEDEAHRLIGKEAMNHGVSRRRIAEQILDEYE